MPHTNSFTHDKESLQTKNNPIDEYTARMDRMVNGLKNKSKTIHHKQMQTTLMWTGIISLLMIAAIFILLNINMKGEPLAFLINR